MSRTKPRFFLLPALDAEPVAHTRNCPWNTVGIAEVVGLWKQPAGLDILGRSAERGLLDSAARHPFHERRAVEAALLA